MVEYGLELYMDSSLDNVTVLSYGKACEYNHEVYDGKTLVFSSSSLTLRDAIRDHGHLMTRCIEAMHNIQHGVPFRIGRERDEL